jgi:asparagine synthase (glutamine-hydrolysing)
MCGIAGIFNYHSFTEPSIELNVKKMLSVIRHRGPDESGMYLGDNLGIGTVRLSIIDIKYGQQPLSDESGIYWIVYNGEIFNYKELRTDIEKKGIRLKTQCDTEVVVQLYAMYGAKCLHQLNGQFSFCIWNKKNKQLFLARDRVGIRPLFYWNQNNSFAFCSEIKGLFTLDAIDRTISTESLAQVFTYWTTLSPNTSFENVYELPPGHYMTVNKQKIEIQQYWSLDFPVKPNQYSTTVSEAVDEFNYLLRDAVKIRLRADVPVAAYLSGGLDSSVTTSLIKEINPEILNTFSIGFKEKEFDESSYQKEAVKYFNTDHTSFECTSEDIAEQFLNTIWHTEFPILRTAPTPMLMLSRKVRERNIKVIITGEGADEFLAGYNIFKESKIRHFWAKEPDSKTRYKLLSRLYPYLPMLKDSNSIASKMFFGYKLTDTGNPFYSHLLRWHNTSRIKNFFSDDIINSINKQNSGDTFYPQLPENFMRWSELARSQFLESNIFMSGYLLSSQGDRVAMANSVEGRYPFLDYRVIEFCNQLPDNLKLNCLQEKFLLKKMSIGKIPSSITKRSKQPYRAPIASTFLGIKQPAYISEMLSFTSLQSYGLFNPQKVNSLIHKIQLQTNVAEVDQMAIAGILSTQLLYMLFIKNPIIPNMENLSNFKIITESTI